MILTTERHAIKTEPLMEAFSAILASVDQAGRRGDGLHAVEGNIFRQLLTLGRQLLERFVGDQGSGDLGATVRVSDERTVRRLDGLFERTYRSIFGDLTLRRTVYGTRAGQKHELAPLDERLQLPDGAYSYLLQDWAQGFAMELSFAGVHDLLAKVLGVSVPVDSLERMNRTMAEGMPAFRESRPAPEPAEEGAVFVVGGDGKGVPMRRALDEVKPPPHRTKGQKANKKRMAIVGVAYSVERYVRTADEVVAALFEDGPKPSGRRPRPCHKRLMAGLTLTDAAGVAHDGTTEVFGWLGDELAKRNPGQVKPTVYLMDGQESLWEACWERLPPENAEEVLDLMHMLPRLWEAAHIFHAEGSREAEAFVRDRLRRVLEGESRYVRIGLRQMATKRGLADAPTKAIDRICTYLEANEPRLRYDVYLAAGYPIASGVLEGACRHFVKDRMERSGMRWTPAGAQAMLDLRACWLNGDWAAYQAFHITRETERVHPHRSFRYDVTMPLAA